MSRDASTNSVETAQSRAKKLIWTPDEDRILRQVLNESGIKQLPNGTTALNGSWGDVAEHLPGRSAKQCRERWCYNLSPMIRRDLWTLEEDAILLTWQRRVGNQWALIARKLCGRTENSVKIRFKSIRRASKRVWTDADDENLLRLHTEIGSRWDQIASLMPGRTRNGVKTRCLLLRKGVVDKQPVLGSPEQILKQPSFLAQMEAIISQSEGRAVAHPPPASLAQYGEQAHDDDEEEEDDAGASQAAGARARAHTTPATGTTEHDDASSDEGSDRPSNEASSEAEADEGLGFYMSAGDGQAMRSTRPRGAGHSRKRKSAELETSAVRRMLSGMPVPVSASSSSPVNPADPEPCTARPPKQIRRPSRPSRLKRCASAPPLTRLQTTGSTDLDLQSSQTCAQAGQALQSCSAVSPLSVASNATTALEGTPTGSARPFGSLWQAGVSAGLKVEPMFSSSPGAGSIGGSANIARDFESLRSLMLANSRVPSAWAPHAGSESASPSRSPSSAAFGQAPSPSSAAFGQAPTPSSAAFGGARNQAIDLLAQLQLLKVIQQQQQLMEQRQLLQRSFDESGRGQGSARMVDTGMPPFSYTSAASPLEALSPGGQAFSANRAQPAYASHAAQEQQQSSVKGESPTTELIMQLLKKL